MRTSLPLPPYSLSDPGPPSSQSLPSSPRSVSAPPSPYSSSLRGVPVRVSLPVVPLRIAMAVLHFKMLHPLRFPRERAESLCRLPRPGNGVRRSRTSGPMARTVAGATAATGRRNTSARRRKRFACATMEFVIGAKNRDETRRDETRRDETRRKEARRSSPRSLCAFRPGCQEAVSSNDK